MVSLILVASVFGGCNSSIKDDDSQGDTVKSTTTIIKKEGESIKANLGEETVNEDIGITIKNVYKMDLEDNEYINLAMYVQITNKSKETNEYSAIDNFGVREQGSTTDNVDLLGLSNSYLYIKKNTSFNRLNGAVAPNTMLDGLVTIRVPKDFKRLHLYSIQT